MKKGLAEEGHSMLRESTGKFPEVTPRGVGERCGHKEKDRVGEMGLELLT